MQTNTINLGSNWNTDHITGFPVTITECFLNDLRPTKTGNYDLTLDDLDSEVFTLHNREQVYQLILDITKTISDTLQYRFTHTLSNGELIGAPCDDQTFDISNAIDLLRALDALGTGNF